MILFVMRKYKILRIVAILKTKGIATRLLALRLLLSYPLCYLHEIFHYLSSWQLTCSGHITVDNFLKVYYNKTLKEHHLTSFFMHNTHDVPIGLPIYRQLIQIVIAFAPIIGYLILMRTLSKLLSIEIYLLIIVYLIYCIDGWFLSGNDSRHISISISRLKLIMKRYINHKTT